ncbi:hypothetical protein [Streptomyces orinoci]|uniref:Uncharacterized protein n=1 Tax=Streptomyces orinoci TaxID=67339 RepID=A0ABV3JZS3_STRON|nr:hypothetical protein [Streptomyces orinoci]
MERLTGRELLALRRALRDPATPGLERWEAARRLGATGEAQQEFAASVVLGSDFPMSVASHIAEALSGFAPRYREQLADRLRGPAAMPGEFDEDRIWAAQALAALGPEYRDEAVAALRATIADPLPGRWQRCRVAQLRWMAAVTLAEIDPSLREEAAETIRRDDISNDGWENELARANHLRDIGGEYAEEATRMLLELRAEVDEEFRHDVDEALGDSADGIDCAPPQEAPAAGETVPPEVPPEVRSALAGLAQLGIPTKLDEFETALATTPPDQVEALAAQYRAYVRHATAPEAVAALTMPVDVSAAQLRRKMPEGGGTRAFVGYSVQAEQQLRELNADESRTASAIHRELEWWPQLGLHRPNRDDRTEDYVLEFCPAGAGRRRLTMVNRFHPELNAVLVTWLLIGP